MTNHSPAQLIAEIERLMDMDYELLPGARHVLEEAIAVIRPLAEKSDPSHEQIASELEHLAKWCRAEIESRSNPRVAIDRTDVEALEQAAALLRLPRVPLADTKPESELR
jgi:hypothetical protein